MSDSVCNETPTEQTIGRIDKFIMSEGVAICKTGLMMSRGGAKRELMISTGGC